MDAVWAAVLLEALTLCAPMPVVTAEEVRRSIVRTDATVEDPVSITRAARYVCGYAERRDGKRRLQDARKWRNVRY